jgi:hypothetical protein
MVVVRLVKTVQLVRAAQLVQLVVAAPVEAVRITHIMVEYDLGSLSCLWYF